MLLDHKQQLLLAEQLSAHEGYRSRPYADTEGHLTIGVGHNLEKGLSRKVIDLIFSEDLDEAAAALQAAFPWVVTLDPVRYRVLVDMNFNLGILGLKGFHNTLRHVQAGEWALAAEGMLSSKWAKQTKKRANTLAMMMLTGRDPFDV